MLGREEHPISTGQPIMSSFEPTMLYLPDTLAHWPGEKIINPHQKEVEAEFDAQFSKFMPHVIELGLAETMRKWDSGTCKSCLVFVLLIRRQALPAAYGLPNASKGRSYAHASESNDSMRHFTELLLLASKYICFGFMVESFTDCLPASVVGNTVGFLRNIMQSPPGEVSKSDHFFVQFTKEYVPVIYNVSRTWIAIFERRCLLTFCGRFFTEFKKVATPNAQKHLYEKTFAFFDSVKDHAKSREMGNFLTVEEYMANRREDIGAWGLFTLTEAPYNIPDDIFSHPMVQEIHIQCIDMMIFDNVGFTILGHNIAKRSADLSSWHRTYYRTAESTLCMRRPTIL